jgi:hypothetical protein
MAIKDRQGDMMERIAVALERLVDVQLNPNAAKTDPRWLDEWDDMDEVDRLEYGHDPRVFAREKQQAVDFAKLPEAEKARYNHNPKVWAAAVRTKAHEERERKAEADRVKVAQDKAKAEQAEADKKHMAEIQARQGDAKSEGPASK